MQQNLTCRDFDPIEVFLEKLFPAEMGTKMILLREIIFYCQKIFQRTRIQILLVQLVCSEFQGPGKRFWRPVDKEIIPLAVVYLFQLLQ